MNKQTTLLIGQATDDQINAWKAANAGGIYGITVENHIGYFKEPNRQEMNQAYSKVDSDAFLDSWEELATLTYIGGSKELLTNDRLFFATARMMKTRQESVKAELVNL